MTAAQGIWYAVVLFSAQCTNNVCVKEQLSLTIHKSKQSCAAFTASLEKDFPKYDFYCVQVQET